MLTDLAQNSIIIVNCSVDMYKRTEFVFYEGKEKNENDELSLEGCKPYPFVKTFFKEKKRILPIKISAVKALIS